MTTSRIVRAVQRRREWIVTIPRDVFITEYFDYTSGQHVTILAPTQWGKTTLMYQLLRQITSPDRQGVILVMKPRDKTVQEWTKQLGYRVIRDWPPPLSARIPRPAGYTLWPKHTFDPETDDERLAAIFRRTILAHYRRGNCVLCADEVVGLTKELRLEREVKTVHTRGAAMGCGAMVSSQRPYEAPLTSYSQAEHLFLGRDPDKRDQQRFAEIGGIDPRIVIEETSRLEQYQWLYIRRTGPEVCIVDR